MINPNMNNRLFEIIDLMDRQYKKPRHYYGESITRSVLSLRARSRSLEEKMIFEGLLDELLNLPSDKVEFSRLRKRIQKLIVPLSNRLKREQGMLKALNNSESIFF